VSFHFITHNLIPELICFGEKFKSAAPLEKYFLRKMVISISIEKNHPYLTSMM